MTYSRKNARLKRQQEVERLQKMLEEGIANYLTDEHYLAYLDALAKFHQYSARNAMLITMQNPDATAVASFMDWKHKFRRHVRAGERGIRIIAPIVQRQREEERERSEEGGTPSVYGFRALSVFDVSQTEGEPLPDIVQNLTGTVPDYAELRAAAAALTGYRITTGSLPADVQGVCRQHSRTIVLREDLSEAMAMKTLVHELAHAKLHMLPCTLPKPIREIQAESVAYIVCAHLGIDTGCYSFGYLISWGAIDKPEFFRDAMPGVVRTASELIQGFDHQRRLAPAEGAAV